MTDTTYTAYTASTAPAAAQETLKTIESKMGFLPNIFATLAESPAALNATVQMGALYNQTALSPAEQQMVALTASGLNGCGYCVAAHTTIAKGANVPADVLDSARNQTPASDSKLEALRQFTRQLVEKRGQVSAADMAAFIQAGYTKAQALDVVYGVAYKTMTNYANAIMHTSIDAAFAPNAMASTAKAA